MGQMQGKYFFPDLFFKDINFYLLSKFSETGLYIIFFQFEII